jgi:hypothetical protein
MLIPGRRARAGVVDKSQDADKPSYAAVQLGRSFLAALLAAPKAAVDRTTGR